MNDIKRVAGLDSLRFVLAFIVLLYHTGYSHVYSIIDRNTIIGKVCSAGLDTLFNGPAAVVVFFIISGFCIHYPNRKQQNIEIIKFYCKRFIRILLPIIICYIVLKLYGNKHSPFTNFVGWSIMCELIYYIIYPLILYSLRFINLYLLLILFLSLSFYLVWSVNPYAFMYPSYGILGNAILGLPCFIIGMILATISNRERYMFLKNIVLVRILIFLLSNLCFSFMLHFKVGFPWTLNFFALFAFLWLNHEILHYDSKLPIKLLEHAGKWSYSLYLVHGLILVLYKGYDIKPYNNTLEWIFLLIIILIASYAYYLIVEKPSRILAKRISLLMQ